MQVDGLHETDNAPDFEVDIVEAINGSFVQEVSWGFAEQEHCCSRDHFSLFDHPPIDSRYC
jgi:hypothetical protein